MAAYGFVQKKIEGLVLDGPIRDISFIRTTNYPIYATGSTPGGPYKMGPGEINTPISCGDICVEPGDIVIGDEDGVVVVPKAEAEKVLALCYETQKKNNASYESAAAGRANRAWVNESLVNTKVEVIE